MLKIYNPILYLAYCIFLFMKDYCKLIDIFVYIHSKGHITKANVCVIYKLGYISVPICLLSCSNS